MNEKFKKCREDNGLNLEQAGDKLGLSPSYVQMLEKGTREITIQVLRKYLCSFPGHFSKDDIYKVVAPDKNAVPT